MIRLVPSFKLKAKYLYVFGQRFLQFRTCQVFFSCMEEILYSRVLGAVHKLGNVFPTAFYHPPTYCNVLAVAYSMTYHSRLCNSNAFADHQPTPIALRNLYTAPQREERSSMRTFFLRFDSKVVQPSLAVEKLSPSQINGPLWFYTFTSQQNGLCYFSRSRQFCTLYMKISTNCLML